MVWESKTDFVHCGAFFCNLIGATIFFLTAVKSNSSNWQLEAVKFTVLKFLKWNCQKPGLDLIVSYTLFTSLFNSNIESFLRTGNKRPDPTLPDPQYP